MREVVREVREVREVQLVWKMRMVRHHDGLITHKPRQSLSLRQGLAGLLG